MCYWLFQVVSSESRLSNSSGMSNHIIVNSNFDMKDAGKTLAIAKVPKYIAEIREKAPENREVARMNITKGKVARYSLGIPNDICTAGKVPIPSNDTLSCRPIVNQTLGIYNGHRKHYMTLVIKWKSNSFLVFIFYVFI